jgi:hypothetical protein
VLVVLVASAVVVLPLDFGAVPLAGGFQSSSADYAAETLAVGWALNGPSHGVVEWARLAQVCPDLVAYQLPSAL